MALTGIEAATARDQARAEEWARVLGVPLVEALARGREGVRLQVSAEGLALAFEDRTRGRPFRLDFTEDLRKLPLARNHIFRRAFGTGRDVIDATAGFGHDTLRALSFGCTVTAIERSPVVFALLSDAVERAREAGGDLAEWVSRLTLVRGDALDVLSARKAEVVYVDPMFTKLKSTAKSPKEMQLLQELFGEHDVGHEAKLLEAARGAARARTIVKRALKARAEGAKPSHTLEGQSVRYDVFLA